MISKYHEDFYATRQDANHEAMSFLAPARVNLIGEHTDYTGGLVLPLAIPFFTRATLQPSDDGKYRFTSDRIAGERSLVPGDRSGAQHEWSDYPVGVLRQLQELGHNPAPFHLTFTSDVPLGSGLSSSASIEVATAFALLHHLGVSMPPEEIARLCQRAENVFVGSPCGIMDQTVSVLAEEGHALLLNTCTLEHEAVPMNLGRLADTSVVICNSLVKHSVATGEYGQRRRELELGQAAVVAANPSLRDLGDARMGDLDRVRESISPESYKRCRHVITENARVREMRESLLAGDAHLAGGLMLQAHASERDDFACSCEEIDFLVDKSAQLPGCYGARLTGGGFGGCTVNLVETVQVEAFSAELKAAYRTHTGLDAELYICEPVDGAWRRSQHGDAYEDSAR